MIQAHIYYSGKVQGVGFRFTTQRLAQELGLTGWVKNLADGRVEILAEGPREVIKKLLTRLDQEFKGHVNERYVDFSDAQGFFRDFSIAF